MSWYAIDAVDDAIDATREFLWGVGLGRWLRLALITFFLGTGGVGAQFPSFSNAPFSGGSFDRGPGPSQMPSADPMPGEIDPVWIVGIVGVVAAVLLLLSVVGAVMEFVFLDGLSTDEVRVLDPFGRHLWPGLRLFGFRLVVTLPALLAVAGAVVAAVLGVVDPTQFDNSVIAGGVVVASVFAFLLGVVRSLTNQLVVPVMFAEDQGVLDGWRRLWPVVRDQPRQTLVYVVVHLLVGVGVGVVRTFLLLLGAIPVTVAAVVVGVAAASAGVSSFGALVVGVVTWVSLLFFFVVLPVNVVAKTYTRAYELCSLAGFDPSLSVLADGLRPTPTPAGRAGSGGGGPPTDTGDAGTDHETDAPRGRTDVSDDTRGASDDTRGVSDDTYRDIDSVFDEDDEQRGETGGDGQPGETDGDDEDDDQWA